MSCNASKFQSSSHRTKLAVSGALSSQYPTFQGLPIPKRKIYHVPRGTKVRVRRGAMVQYRGEITPYMGVRPITVEDVFGQDEILIACTPRGNTSSPSKAFGEGLVDSAFTTDHLRLFFQRCGILLSGMAVCGPELIHAPTPKWMVQHLSDWLTMDQIKILLQAGRIQYLRSQGRIEIYLMAPGRVFWAGEKGYYREASTEDVEAT